MSLVLDASCAMSLFLEAEERPAVSRMLSQMIAHGAWTPSLWRLGIANALQTLVRRGILTALSRDASLADLATLPIETDAETGNRAWGQTLRLAEKHKLTVYDAAYLELALRRGLPLATLDLELRSAAEAEGVGLLGK